jgi:hypothetical protein
MSSIWSVFDSSPFLSLYQSMKQVHGVGSCRVGVATSALVYSACL